MMYKPRCKNRLYLEIKPYSFSNAKRYCQRVSARLRMNHISAEGLCRDDSIAWGLILDDVSASGEFIMDEWKDARPAVAALKKWEAA